MERNLEPIPKYADVFTFEEFKTHCSQGIFINYDGIGYYATDCEMSNIPVDCSNIVHNPKFSYIAWFNK